MKISEFAKHNQITAKMLRHYDEIGLLKPAAVDPETGYRVYSPDQSHRLNWILVLKNLEFSLSEIKAFLDGPISSEVLLSALIQKRIAIANGYNEQIQKRLQIDRLIQLIEAEGFKMERSIKLMDLTQESVHELKKNMPNTEMFLEQAQAVAQRVEAGEHFGILRVDLCQFKSVNDIDGFEIGDKVILAFYQTIMTVVAPLGANAAVGRAGGDEFVAIIKGGQDTMMRIGTNLINEMKATDYKKMGCHKQIALYFGAIVTQKNEHLNLRQLIDDTYESLVKAKAKGENGMSIEVR